jgi:hypothetical protein
MLPSAKAKLTAGASSFVAGMAVLGHLLDVVAELALVEVHVDVGRATRFFRR